MRARVRAAGHAVHPMLIVFPLGLFITGFVFDVVQLLTGNVTFGQVGFWTITGGLIGAVLAALCGVIDWLGVPTGTRARGVGLWHGLLNVVTVVLFLISWFIRLDRPDHAVSGGLIVLEVLAVGVLTAAAWLGGELVERHGIGVDADAHPDAPSSLSRDTTVRTR